MNIFENSFYTHAHTNLDNPEFNKRTKVQDWRNYVPDEFVKEWNNLTEREKKIIVIMAEAQADNEEWD